MSVAAVLEAVQNRLRKVVTINRDDAVEASPDPQPYPDSGNVFIAVYAIDWSNPNTELMHGLDETFGVACCVSMKGSFSPIRGHAGNLYLKALFGLEAICRKVMLAVHQDYVIVGEANNLIRDVYPTAETDEIIEPLRWLKTDPVPTFQDHSWWHSDDDSDTFAGMSMTVYFGGARRIQARDEGE